MPLVNGRQIRFIPHPTDLPPTTKVFQIRFTGEIFTEYTDYSARLDFYRQPKFSCKYTGKTGFNYENALSHEIQTKSQIYNHIPSQYIPIILQNIQFSQLKLTDLMNSIADKLIQSQQQPQNTENNKQNTKPTPETTTNNSNKNNSTSKKQSKHKCPIKKTLIRTLIRITASQYNFKTAPWILDINIANKYNISTQIPLHLQTLINDYLTKKNAPKKRKIKPKLKSKSVSVKPETLISKLCISTNKQLKYPCDDQLLLMYDRYENNNIIKYDTLWNNINKIGINNNNNNNNNDIDDDNYSNLAFIDYNMLYDDGSDADNDIDMNVNVIKHRQLNDFFSDIWNIWSFINIYYNELNIQPFPISYLMDSLCYDKRCILFDELQVCLLEVIRKHMIQSLENKIETQKENKIKKKIARKKAKKANKRAAKRKRLKKLQKEKEEKEKKNSDKQEMDQSDDDDNKPENDNDEPENEESEMDEESEEEESEDSDSEEDTESESDSDSETESDTSQLTEDEIDVMDIIDSNPKYNSLIFNIEPIHHFRLDLLRDYLEYRCNMKDEMAQDNDNDSDDDMDNDNDIDIDMKSEITEKTDIINIEFDDALLPDNGYILNDYIWDKLNNIRNYISLGIEGKLDIIKILFKDVMDTCIINNIIKERINKYQSIKYDIKDLDDQLNNMVKEDKNKLKSMRNQLIEKKRILYPRKQKSKNNSKKTSKNTSKNVSKNTSKDSSKNPSKNATKSPSDSPNKENKASKSNSAEIISKPRITSRQQELLRKQQEREKEILKKEVEKLEYLIKNNKQLMDSACRIKDLEIRYKKYKLLSEYNTYLIELGCDRFYNKYYWSLYSDGRIFILHSNTLYHNINNNDNNISIMKEMIKLKHDNIKCYNEWEIINDSNNNNNNENENKFCWSYISTSTQLYELLNVLDGRGVRENELLLTLNALKKDIIMGMKMVGNDDYKCNEEMSVDVNENNNENDGEPVRQLRRSKRAIKGGNNNKQDIMEHIQAGNKGFLSYKNKMKRK